VPFPYTFPFWFEDLQIEVIANVLKSLTKNISQLASIRVSLANEISLLSKIVVPYVKEILLASCIATWLIQDIQSVTTVKASVFFDMLVRAQIYSEEFRIITLDANTYAAWDSLVMLSGGVPVRFYTDRDFIEYNFHTDVEDQPNILEFEGGEEGIYDDFTSPTITKARWQVI